MLPVTVVVPYLLPVQWFSTPIPAPPLGTRLVAIALAFVIYFFVPTTRTCERDLKIRDDLNTMHILCADPAFDVSCRASSIYHAADNTAILCRTQMFRPVRVLDNLKRQRAVCDSTFGWLANYDPDRGCFCDYYSELRHGVCILTEETCRGLFGSGATVQVNELGYADQCACRRGNQLLAASARCDQPSPQSDTDRLE